MKKTILFSLSLLFFTIKSFGQNLSADYINSFKQDKTLKEVWEYVSTGKDSFLTSIEYYANGLLQIKKSFSRNVLKTESTYKYNEYNLPWTIETVYKDSTLKDTSKSFTVYLYDQYKNLYLERHSDSIPGSYHLDRQMFTNYFYQDSLIIYSNMINDLGYGIQSFNRKFEYDDKRQLKKIYDIDTTNDSTKNARLTDELFYDKNGNHIMTIYYRQNFVTNSDSTKTKQPFENDFITYTYNSNNQLLEEFRCFRNMFTVVPFLKEAFKYNYDNKGKLISISHSIDNGNIYTTNRYFKY